MPAAGVVLIIAVVLIVLALVYYLVSTIVQLRAVTNGLDEVIASVGEIVDKSAPVEPVVADINDNLDAPGRAPRPAPPPAAWPRGSPRSARSSTRARPSSLWWPTSTTTSTPRSARSRACWSRRPGWRTPSGSSTACTPAPRRPGCAASPA